MILAMAVLGLAAGPALAGNGKQVRYIGIHPLPKGIRLLGLGLHNLTEINSETPAQLGLAI